MKFGLKLTDINLGEIKIGSMEVNTDLSIREMVCMREQAEVVLKMMPEYLEDIAKGARKFEELEEEFSERFKAKLFNSQISDAIEHTIIKELFNNNQE